MNSNKYQTLKKWIKNCRLCDYGRKRDYYIPVCNNSNNSKIAVIFDKPDFRDIYNGNNLISGIRANKFLYTLKKSRIDKNSLFITTLIKCYQDREPTEEHVARCCNWLKWQLRWSSVQGIIGVGETVNSWLEKNLLQFEALFLDEFKPEHFKKIREFVDEFRSN